MSDALRGNGEALPDAADVEASLEVFEPDNSLPRLSISGLSPALANACLKAGWEQLTPVQSLALPCLLAARDIMVQSRTGSGKTGAYLLPMLERLDLNIHQPQALILVPTRELALQVEHEASLLFADSGLASCSLYGGVGFKKQLEALKNGSQVVIATPGRALDHIFRNSLDLSALRMLIFDEADRMLSIGFYPDMREIARHLPKKRQTALFSATYPPHVLRLAGEFMRDPQMLSLSRDKVHVAEVEHLFCQVKRMDKDRALVRLLEIENPASAIIFCNTKSDVHYITEVLKGFGYRADELSSDLSQKNREAVMARLRKGETRYLVATDVAARGIDIPDLSHVFLYTPPEDHEGYIHRAGRTGRAGAAGVVISLVDVMEKLELERIGRHFRINLREIPLPDDEEVARTVCGRLTAVLEGRLRTVTGLEKLRINRYLPLARELAARAGDEDDCGVEIMAMLLDDCHRVNLNENRLPAAAAPPLGSRKHVKPKSGRRGGARKPRTPEDKNAD